VGALLALALPAQTAPGSPAPALGAAGLGVADRVERLLGPSQPGPGLLYQSLVLYGLLVAPLALAAMIVTQVPLCVTAALG